MLRNSATISDRLRRIFSDLSSFVGEDESSRASPVYESRDRDSFLKRVHSFRSSLWFAKPRWLSPVVCARYGWENIGVDLLQCAGCKSVLVVRTPSSFDPVIYDACQKRLEDQLKKAAHHPCCTWPSCPTNEVVMLAIVGGCSQTDVVEGFINTTLQLVSVGKDLPVIEDTCLNVTESDVAALCCLVQNSPKFSHDAEIPCALQSAVLLALSGWCLSDGSKPLSGCTSVKCSLCMRQPGLWNYKSITDVEDQASSGDSDVESSLDCQANTAQHSDVQNAGVDFLSDKVDDQVLMYDNSGKYSEPRDVSFQAAREEFLSLATADECSDLQKLVSEDVQVVGDAQDRLSRSGSDDDEPCSPPVVCDTHCDRESSIKDIPGVNDTDDNGGHHELADLAQLASKHSMSTDVDKTDDFRESLDVVDNVTCAELPVTSPVTVEEEKPSIRDVGEIEEVTVVKSSGDSDVLDVCPEFASTSHHIETKLSVLGSDIEETTIDSKEKPIIPCNTPDGNDPGKLISSDLVEHVDDEHVVAKVELTESGVHCAEYIESLLQKNSAEDVESEEMMLDVSSTLR